MCLCGRAGSKLYLSLSDAGGRKHEGATEKVNGHEPKSKEFDVDCRICAKIFSTAERCLLSSVDPAFRALSGRHKFTVRRHKFNKDSLLSRRRMDGCSCTQREYEVVAHKVNGLSHESQGRKLALTAHMCRIRWTEKTLNHTPQLPLAGSDGRAQEAG